MADEKTPKADKPNEADAQPTPKQAEASDRKRAGTKAGKAAEAPEVDIIDSVHPPKMEEEGTTTFEEAQEAGYLGRRPLRPDYSQRGVLPFEPAPEPKNT